MISRKRGYPIPSIGYIIIFSIDMAVNWGLPPIFRHHFFCNFCCVLWECPEVLRRNRATLEATQAGAKKDGLFLWNFRFWTYPCVFSLENAIGFLEVRLYFTIFMKEHWWTCGIWFHKTRMTEGTTGDQRACDRDLGLAGLAVKSRFWPKVLRGFPDNNLETSLKGEWNCLFVWGFIHSEFWTYSMFLLISLFWSNWSGCLPAICTL